MFILQIGHNTNKQNAAFLYNSLREKKTCTIKNKLQDLPPKICILTIGKPLNVEITSAKLMQNEKKKKETSAPLAAKTVHFPSPTLIWWDLTSQWSTLDDVQIIRVALWCTQETAVSNCYDGLIFTLMDDWFWRRFLWAHPQQSKTSAALLEEAQIWHLWLTMVGVGRGG